MFLGFGLPEAMNSHKLSNRSRPGHQLLSETLPPSGTTCSKLSVLVSYCSITNYHKFRGLKQHSFISSVSLGQKSRHGLTGSSAQGLTRLQSRCRLSCISFWGSESSSNSHGRIKILVVVGPSSRFSCWWLARDYAQLLECSHTALSQTLSQAS